MRIRAGADLLDDDWSLAKGAPTGNICSGDAVAPSPSEMLVEAEAVLDQQPSWIITPDVQREEILDQVM